MTETSELTYRLFIDGVWTDSSGEDILEVENPATEENIGRVPQATLVDARRAIEAARRAFDEGPWPRMSPADRASAMLRLADVMERRKAEIVDLNIRETGSVRELAESLQTSVGLDHFRDMAERVMPQFEWQQALLPYFSTGIGQGVIRREPYGVAALISAYNFPFLLNLLKLAPALAAGCTTVLKPAPTTPLQALFIAECVAQADLPPGVVNVVTGDLEAGRELTTNPMVDIVSFTGSDSVGRSVYVQAAASMKKVVLELGGKSANIILDDADLDLVVPNVVANFTLHAGQGCSLLTRTLVHESLRDELLARLKSALDEVKVGDPMEPTTTMGPLISAQQRHKVEASIGQAVEEGAGLAYGGGRTVGLDRGYFLDPTVFIDVRNTMTIAREECFGPVAVISNFRDDAEAVHLANDSDYGLGGGVWSKSAMRAYAIATQIRTGEVLLNGGGGGMSPYQAFGGYKQSGLGREWGTWGLTEFLQTKSITWSAAGG